LAPDASKLPTILAELPDSALGAVRANLAMLVPGIASFDIVDDGDDFHIEFELSGGERVPARLVSNGTLRVLALLTAIYMEPRPPILGIEEPENGIFPGRIRLLLEKLRQIAAEDTTAYVQQRWENARQSMSIVQGINVNHLPTQILVTTHSTVILSALLSQSQHLRFVDMVRRNGERVTRARTVGPVKSPQDGRFVITPGEIEAILDAAHGEAAE
jgi:predicted ATPase